MTRENEGVLFSGHPDQAFGHITYAQFGEDLIIANAFALLGIQRPSYLDIGAHHPFNCSNTALLYQRGSRGINIEPNPELIGAFQAHRPEDLNLSIGASVEEGRIAFYRIDNWSGRNTFDKATADAFVAAYPQFQINDVLNIDVLPINLIVDRYAAGVFPDLLSIDAEGLDYELLVSCDFTKSKPRVICAETLSGGDFDDHLRMKGFLEKNGFELFGRTFANMIFIAQ